MIVQSFRAHSRTWHFAISTNTKAKKKKKERNIKSILVRSSWKRGNSFEPIAGKTKILCVCVCRKIDRDRINVLKLRPLYIERIVPCKSQSKHWKENFVLFFFTIFKRFSRNEFAIRNENVYLCCKNAATISRSRKFETELRKNRITRKESCNNFEIVSCCPIIVMKTNWCHY